MKINNCRNCNSKKLSKIFTLGKMSFTGKFAKSLKIDIPKAVVSLLICKVCKLVQLDRNYLPLNSLSIKVAIRTQLFNIFYL